MTPVRRTAARLARPAIRLSLSLLSALLLGGYANAPSLAFLPYVSLVPWVILYTDDRQPRVSIGYYVFGTWVAWMVCYATAAQYGWFALPAMGLVLFPCWIPFAPIIRRIHHGLGWPRTLTVPVAWVAVEWVRSTFTYADFDLFALGYSQARFPALVQVADVTGVYGISFLVAAVNGLVADAIFAIRDEPRGIAAVLKQPRLLRSATAVAAAFSIVAGYGFVKLSTARHAEGPRVAVIQPNVAHQGRNVVGVHLSEVLLTDRMVQAGTADLIVWPENAILDNIRRDEVYLEDLKWLAARKQAMLLVGATGRADREPGKYTNSAYLVDDRGRILGRYDKQVLFPWSERIPFDAFLGRWWPGLQRLQRTAVRLGWGFLPAGAAGDRMTLFDFPWRDGVVPFATVICVENTYPVIPAEAGRIGARFFVNITSEGGVGGVVQEQLLRICMLRAIENRIAYVRCGNTGISCLLDSEGRLVDILRGERGGTILDAGVLLDRVPLSPPGATLYARSHDAFAKACVLAAVALLVATYFRGRRRLAAAAVAVGLLLLVPSCVRTPTLGGDPAAADASLQRGRELFEQKRPAVAIGILEAACVDSRRCGQALPFLMESYRLLSRDEEAIDLFDEVSRRFPDLAGEAMACRAFYLERLRDFEGARRDYAEALARSPTSKTWGLLANLRLRLGDVAGAIDGYRRALELSPGDPNLRYLLARALRMSGDLEGAASILDALVFEQPRDANAWSLLGRVHYQRGDTPGAVAALRTAIGLNPKNIEARFWMARIALREGDLRRAQLQLREIVRLEAALGRGLAID